MFIPMIPHESKKWILSIQINISNGKEMPKLVQERDFESYHWNQLE
mgnify:FL=1